MHEHNKRNRSVDAYSVYQQLVNLIVDKFCGLLMEELCRDLVDSPACLCDYNRPVDDVDSMLLFSEWDIDVLVDDTCDHCAYDNEPDVD